MQNDEQSDSAEEHTGGNPKLYVGENCFQSFRTSCRLAHWLSLRDIVL